MDYNVQYEETEPGHILVTLTTAEGDVVAEGTVQTMVEAHEWATTHAEAHHQELHPPEPAKGSFVLSVGD